MNALTYTDYFGIALFTIGLCYFVKFMLFNINILIKIIKNRYHNIYNNNIPKRSTVHDILIDETGWDYSLLERILRLEQEQGLIKSYKISEKDEYLEYELYDGIDTNIYVNLKIYKSHFKELEKGKLNE